MQLLKFFEAWGSDEPVPRPRAVACPRSCLAEWQRFTPSLPRSAGRIRGLPADGSAASAGGKLPLNIFEQRYLAMTLDSLAAGRMFGMIQPDPTRPRPEMVPAFTASAAWAGCPRSAKPMTDGC